MACRRSGSNMTDYSIWILKFIEASELFRTNQMSHNTLHGTSSWRTMSWTVLESSWPELNVSKHGMHFIHHFKWLNWVCVNQITYWRQKKSLVGGKKSRKTAGLQALYWISREDTQHLVMQVFSRQQLLLLITKWITIYTLKRVFLYEFPNIDVGNFKWKLTFCIITA